MTDMNIKKIKLLLELYNSFDRNYNIEINKVHTNFAFRLKLITDCCNFINNQVLTYLREYKKLELQ